MPEFLVRHVLDVCIISIEIITGFSYTHLIKVNQRELSHNEICGIEVEKSNVPIFACDENSKQYFFVRQGNSTNKLEEIEFT